jgi:hypothetical protein
MFLKSPLFNSSYAFRTQKWFNLVRYVLRFRKIQPLVSFLVGWWAHGLLIALMMKAVNTFEM